LDLKSRVQRVISRNIMEIWFVHRCRIIPLVNMHWNAVHKDNPPVREEFSIESLPVVSSRLTWFLRVARSISIMDVQSWSGRGVPAAAADSGSSFSDQASEFIHAAVRKPYPILLVNAVATHIPGVGPMECRSQRQHSAPWWAVLSEGETYSAAVVAPRQGADAVRKSIKCLLHQEERGVKVLLKLLWL
jgi:hypothetical protein